MELEEGLEKIKKIFCKNEEDCEIINNPLTQGLIFRWETNWGGAIEEIRVEFYGNYFSDGEFYYYTNEDLYEIRCTGTYDIDDRTIGWLNLEDTIKKIKELKEKYFE